MAWEPRLKSQEKLAYRLRICPVSSPLLFSRIFAMNTLHDQQHALKYLHNVFQAIIVTNLLLIVLPKNDIKGNRSLNRCILKFSIISFKF